MVEGEEEMVGGRQRDRQTQLHLVGGGGGSVREEESVRDEESVRGEESVREKEKGMQCTVSALVELIKSPLPASALALDGERKGEED